MLDLSSEPSLGSLVLTSGGTLKYIYVLPRGMTFSNSAGGTLRFSDRTGGEYGNFEGTVSSDLTRMVWKIGPAVAEGIPAGANFEVFVTVDGDTYKVRYGKVVRKGDSNVLAVGSGTTATPVYEDDMQRSIPGPRWLIKGGRMAMQQVSGVSGGVSYAVGYAMCTRNKNDDVWGNSLNLFTESGALWYAPLTSDNIEILAGLADNNNGKFTIVFASNSAMTRWLGVRFYNPWLLQDGNAFNETRYQHQVQVVSGTAWGTYTLVGSAATYQMPTTGAVLKVLYNGTNKTVSVYSGATLILTTSTASTAALTGTGYRYVGAVSEGSYAYTGPRLYYWKVRDV